MARQDGFYSIQFETEKFRRATERQIRMSGKRAADVVKSTALELATRLYNNTPVDKGQAAAGWVPLFVKLNAPVPSRRGSSDAAATLGSTQGEAVVDLNEKSPNITIINAVPHIIPLEFGHSQQAPNGTFRIVMAGMRGELGRQWAKQPKRRPL